MNELLAEADRLELRGNPLGQVIRRYGIVHLMNGLDPNVSDNDGFGDGFYNFRGDGKGRGRFAGTYDGDGEGHGPWRSID